MQKQEHFVVWSMGLYFGWILSFPYFGYVLRALSISTGVDPNSLALVFLIFHALGFFCGAIFLKDTNRWKGLMFFSLVAVLLISIIKLFVSPLLWMPLMAISGFFSPFYILGWSCLIATYPSHQKPRLILTFVIIANLITILLIYLSCALNLQALLIAKIAPLIIALLLLFFYSPPVKAAIEKKSKPDQPPTALYIIVMVAFITLLNLTLGLAFSVIFDSYSVMSGHDFVLRYFKYIPYILIYLVIIFFRVTVDKRMAYYSVSLMGLALILLIVMGDSITGFYFTITAVQIGQALYSIFIWVLLGDLSTRYATPFRYFGFGLFAILLGSFLGGAYGDYLLKFGDSPALFTALASIAALFAALLVTPWLVEKSATEPMVDDKLLTNDQEYLDHLYSAAGLTPREIDVVEILMKGSDNQSMAATLGISSNTLKTHLRKIYGKYGVNKKSELLALISTKKMPPF
ncbi:MAG: LuxR C-terminal-related transcriptional regulator [Bacillota bacterium]